MSRDIKTRYILCIIDPVIDYCFQKRVLFFEGEMRGCFVITSLGRDLSQVRSAIYFIIYHFADRYTDHHSANLVW